MMCRERRRSQDNDVVYHYVLFRDTGLPHLLHVSHRTPCPRANPGTHVDRHRHNRRAGKAFRNGRIDELLSAARHLRPGRRPVRYQRCRSGGYGVDPSCDQRQTARKRSGQPQSPQGHPIGRQTQTRPVAARRNGVGHAGETRTAVRRSARHRRHGDGETCRQFRQQRIHRRPRDRSHRRQDRRRDRLRADADHSTLVRPAQAHRHPSHGRAIRRPQTDRAAETRLLPRL